MTDVSISTISDFENFTTCGGLECEEQIPPYLFVT